MGSRTFCSPPRRASFECSRYRSGYNRSGTRSARTLPRHSCRSTRRCLTSGCRILCSSTRPQDGPRWRRSPRQPMRRPWGTCAGSNREPSRPVRRSAVRSNCTWHSCNSRRGPSKDSGSYRRESPGPRSSRMTCRHHCRRSRAATPTCSSNRTRPRSCRSPDHLGNWLRSCSTTAGTWRRMSSTNSGSLRYSSSKCPPCSR
mmetsp:Transcript_17046/g.35625  ORF Transcript_17046/g.35625 Transcript_17046/m.35625 type:complete len:201 (+) Transcript_17046:340-942(+)